MHTLHIFFFKWESVDAWLSKTTFMLVVEISIMKDYDWSVNNTVRINKIYVSGRNINHERLGLKC